MIEPIKIGVYQPEMVMNYEIYEDTKKDRSEIKCEVCDTYTQTVVFMAFLNEEIHNSVWEKPGLNPWVFLNPWHPVGVRRNPLKNSWSISWLPSGNLT